MNKKLIRIAMGIALLGVPVYLGVSVDRQEVTVASVPATDASDSVLAIQDTAAHPHGARPASHTHAPGDWSALDPQIRAALRRMLNTSSEGLVEQTRNGVTRLDLQGRFQTVPVATLDENGEIHIHDYTHLPAEARR